MFRAKKVALLSALLVLFFVSPVWADIGLDINGKNYLPAAKPVVKDGITFIQLEELEKVLGANTSFSSSDNWATISKNGKVIKMFVGENWAYIDGEKIEMPAAVLKNDKGIMVPLRFIAENLGFSLAWDKSSRVVKINYDEKREGMSVEEVFLKASQKMNGFKKYRMVSEAEFDLKIEGLPEETNGNVNIKAASSSESFYQKEPLAMYVKQKILMELPPEMTGDSRQESVDMESLFVGNNYYMRMGEKGWIKMDMSGLNLEQVIEKYNSSNPAVMMQIIKDWGMISVFRDDKVIDGKEYWVINTVVDKDKFMNEYEKFMGAFMQSMPSETKQIMKDASFDFNCISYINKETFINEMTEMDMKMKMGMEVPEAKGQKVWLYGTAHMKGYITDFDKDFALPDVSGALDIAQLADKDKN